MADALTAAQLTAYSGRVLRPKVYRAATIDNDSISAADISSRIKSWGSVKYEVYNRHPSDRGDLVLPVLSLIADNSDGYFDRGGAVFPNGVADFASTIAVVTIWIAVPATHLVLNFSGRVREPEYTERGEIELIVEHALTDLHKRKWVRADRSGGDTGEDYTV